MKNLKRELKMLLKWLCLYLKLSNECIYSYDFFLDNQVYFWNGLAHLLRSICGTDLVTNKNIKMLATVKTRFTVTIFKNLTAHWNSIICDSLSPGPQDCLPWIVFFNCFLEVICSSSGYHKWKTKTGQKRAGFCVSKTLSFAGAERERETDCWN